MEGVEEREIIIVGAGICGLSTALALHRVWEIRCLRRCDLINTLAESLPSGTIRFGCQVLSVELDPLTSLSILQLSNGSVLKAKTRGFTKYRNGYHFSNDFVHVNGDHVALGRMPIDDKSVFWFVTHKSDQGSNVPKNIKLIKISTLELIKGFPQGMVEMISNSDPDSVHSANLRYRPPHDVLLKPFRRGTVTVAGDAMHAMYPFLGQGGSAGLEDAIVLTRFLVETFHQTDGGQKDVKGIEMALEEYVKQRRMRPVWLTLQIYLTGLLF
ncbi:hypothetical protein L6164_023579 [Bauhinia variegata]|uniref:Uncharacterized protein n=1 Tax=Bauhinia variegata TaxID=167791 RepID=A0ACB9MK20_BAUVA|nr:hypothetical protein L6164_023579 [Bauhinia variegata]